jgi:hypothetical protein
MSKLTKQEVLIWSQRYDREGDLYNTGLERELGDKLRDTKGLTKNQLIQIVEWKFQGRLLGRRKIILNRLSAVDDSFIRKASNESFNEPDDRLKIKKLMGRYGGIKGVGLALASVILTFYDPRNYGVYDIHAWRELMGSQPKDLFSNFENLMKFLERLRQEAERMGLDARIVEKAYFKKNLDRSEGCTRPSQRVTD